MLPFMQSLPDQKGRGAFYTPPQIVRPMVSWAIRSPADHVLDGGAGESIFLTGAAERLVHLGASCDAVCQQVHGVELDGLAATLAKKALAATLDLEDCGPRIFNGNFFDEIPSGKSPSFKLV